MKPPIPASRRRDNNAAVLLRVASLIAISALLVVPAVAFVAKPRPLPPSSIGRSAAAAAAFGTRTSRTMPLFAAQPQPPPPQTNNNVNYNEIEVAKTGVRGVTLPQDNAQSQQLSLGAPPPRRPTGGHYLTRGGVQVTADVNQLRYGMKKGEPGSSAAAVEGLIKRLDERRGCLLNSSYEFPGRYARWSLGFVDPPLEISGAGSECTIRALNGRGRVILPAVVKAMEGLRDDGILADVTVSSTGAGGQPGPMSGTGDALEMSPSRVDVTVVPPPPVGTFSEEERSKQPSLFSVVRALVDLFSYDGGDGQLGLYGAFGYDLTFQFEPIDIKQPRDPNQRDLLLYLPDEILVVDKNRHDAWRISYDFCFDGRSTQGMPRDDGERTPFIPFDEAKDGPSFQPRDTPKSEFASSVERAKREFAVGNLFEAVLSQTFREKLDERTTPSVLFRRLRSRNPSPYGFFFNLGENEYLVGASPEMFVRCEKTPDSEYGPDAIRVETCPISGTVARGADALEDAARIKSLMMNAKEESELTMCTDVDRNDKSRICEPGSVKVIGRRQIEMYSRLIHTVDHVEGYLRPNFDSLDAFLCHTWAVTVTGAPKTWAIQFVEDNERSPRCWYGGAVGLVGFDGSLNTGLTLRTVRVKDGVAEVRAGATLLYDSSPPAEELETELKASAMIDAIVQKGQEEDDEESESRSDSIKEEKVGEGKNVILIDHEDSFVHTLGNYLRQTGADVMTLRSGPSALSAIEGMIGDGKRPDMVILSPGPGNPSDFGLSDSLDLLTKHKIPTFGVCLGLQGMVEHFGGTLGVLGYPMHGKQSHITVTASGKADGSIFTSLPDTFEVARYHSLHGIRERLPSCLEVTAQSEDGIVMGIRHRALPFAAVQFHPESILTSPAHGMTILMNALSYLRHDDERDDGTSMMESSGAEVVAGLEMLSIGELREKLSSAGLSTGGTKSELVVRLALWTHKRNAIRAGRLVLEDLPVTGLKDLKHGLGLKGAGSSKENLVSALGKCLM